MKKLLSVLLSAVMLTLCSCGSSDNQSSSAVEESEAEITVTEAEVTTAEVTTTIETTTIEVTTAPPTAYDQLTPKEIAVFNALCEAANSFKSPSSIKLIRCGLSWSSNSVFAEISGTNSMGGTVSNIYMLFTANDGDHYIGELMDVSEFATQDLMNSIYDTFNQNTEEMGTKYIDIGHINNALKEYWESKGLL